MLEKLILCSIISSRIDKIVDEKLNRAVRPTLNLFIRKPLGYGFTTVMTYLAEKGYVNYISEFTAPGLVGTLKNGRVIPGALADSGYKLTAIDEVRLLDQKAKKAILELTEMGRATRVLQGYVEKRIEKKITGGRLIADVGKMVIEVHTAFVFGTASDEIMQDPDVKMLFSRCFCINVSMDAKEAVMLKSKGRDIKLNTDIIPDEPVDEVILPEDMNDILLDRLTENALVDLSEGGYFTRAHDDLIRLSAIRAVACKRTEVNKKDVEFALKLYPLHQMGYLGVQLNETALKVYEKCEGRTIKEIASEVGISEQWTRKLIKLLIEMRLVAKIHDKYFKTMQ